MNTIRKTITYRELARIINEEFTEEQKDSDLTVEDSIEQECYSAELRICDNNHDSLEDGHPVIYY
jgi:hypothetical protein